MPAIYLNERHYAGNVYDSQPIGQIIQVDGTKPLAGYLPCDGRSLKRNEYPALFKQIGTKYGAEDDEHFNLPNAQEATIGGGGIEISKADYEELSDEEKDRDISYYIPDSDGVDIQVIDDDNVREETTWSSNKINGALANCIKIIGNYNSHFHGTSFEFALADLCGYKLIIARGADSYIEYFCAYFGGVISYFTLNANGPNPCLSISSSGNVLNIKTQDWDYITVCLYQIF